MLYCSSLISALTSPALCKLSMFISVSSLPTPPFICSSVDGRGNTPLHLATLQGHTEVVKLLSALEADLGVRDQAGYEPVHMAALHGHVNCLMTLVAMGATINSQTDDKKTPLHLAAMRSVWIGC